MPGSAKLTEKQERWLRFCEEIGGGLYPMGAGAASVCRSLVAKGLMSRIPNGPFFVTTAGRTALERENAQHQGEQT